jgi:hypothetical protein
MSALSPQHFIEVWRRCFSEVAWAGPDACGFCLLSANQSTPLPGVEESRGRTVPPQSPPHPPPVDIVVNCISSTLLQLRHIIYAIDSLSWYGAKPRHEYACVHGIGGARLLRLRAGRCGPCFHIETLLEAHTPRDMIDVWEVCARGKQRRPSVMTVLAGVSVLYAVYTCRLPAYSA